MCGVRLAALFARCLWLQKVSDQDNSGFDFIVNGEAVQQKSECDYSL